MSRLLNIVILFILLSTPQINFAQINTDDSENEYEERKKEQMLANDCVLKEKKCIEIEQAKSDKSCSEIIIKLCKSQTQNCIDQINIKHQLRQKRILEEGIRRLLSREEIEVERPRSKEERKRGWIDFYRTDQNKPKKKQPRIQQPPRKGLFEGGLFFSKTK